MDMKTEERIVINAPRLGQLVELVEPRVGEVMAMQRARNDRAKGDEAAEAQAEAESPLVFEVLALCLRIDGERYSAEELLNFGARKTRALMSLTGQAMAMAGFLDDEPEEDGGPKG